MKEHLRRKQKKAKRSMTKEAKRSKCTFIHLRFDFSTYKLGIIKTLLSGCAHHPFCFHFDLFHVTLILQTTRKNAS